MNAPKSWWIVALIVVVLAIAALPLLPSPGEPYPGIKGSEGLSAPDIEVFLVDGDRRVLDDGATVPAGAEVVLRATLSEPAVIGLILDEGKGAGLAWQSPSQLPAGPHEINLEGNDWLPKGGHLGMGVLVSTEPFHAVLYDLDKLCGQGAPCSRFVVQIGPRK
jgi:hypothetical protein